MTKLRIITIVITPENNPSNWTEASLAKLTNGEVVVGYILKNKGIRSNIPRPVLNLYIIPEHCLTTPNSIIDLKTLQNIFLQWMESLVEDSKSYMFRNPPLEEWLNTKENWVKKISAKLSQSYNKPYDECMSSLYMVILQCYRKEDIYLGNLHYLIVAANNKLKLEFRFMQNRLYGGHPSAIHLDASPSDFNAGLEDSIASLHEIIGGTDDEFHSVDREQEILDAMLVDLREDFTEREIDQIKNTPGFLPMSLYRRLLKWRKTHKLEDYI